MTKNLIIKVISGSAQPEEKTAVVEWVNQEKRNLSYFLELKDLWISQQLPLEKAGNEYLSQLNSIIERKEEINFDQATQNQQNMRNHILLYKRLFLSSAAIITLLLALHITFFMLNKSKNNSLNNEPRITLNEYPTEYQHTIFTNKGVKAFTQLPDGSKVWLNSNSKITFPDTFLGATREVTFSGEAYFEVAKDSLRPMMITTNRNFEVKVLGTKFNLKANDNDSEAMVTLVSGSVEIITTKEIAGKMLQSSIVLNNQQSYIVSDNKQPALVKVSDTLKHTAWKSGKLIFDSTPLHEVIKQLERWHGVDFMVEDNAAFQTKLTAEFDQESIVQIMEMLKFCSGIDYRMPDRRRVVIGMKK